MVIYTMLRVESVKNHLKQIQVEVGRSKGSDTFIYCITYVRIYNRKRYTRWASTSQVIYLGVIAPISRVIFHPSYPIIRPIYRGPLSLHLYRLGRGLGGAHLVSPHVDISSFLDSFFLGHEKAWKSS